jgi:hypothetical protein
LAGRDASIFLTLQEERAGAEVRLPAGENPRPEPGQSDSGASNFGGYSASAMAASLVTIGW